MRMERLRRRHRWAPIAESPSRLDRQRVTTFAFSVATKSVTRVLLFYCDKVSAGTHLPRPLATTCLRGACLQLQLAIQKLPDRDGDFLVVRFQGQMPGVVKDHFGTRVIAFESF